jgi:hypothetical protein
MLSEIRAYGEGVLIAEQIPVKLAPDAIKNTNLKILHRVVAEDDRQVVGATMNLTDEQLRAVTTFARGNAAVYAEGNDHPFLVEVFAFKSKSVRGRISDADVRAAMASQTTRSAVDARARDDAVAVTEHPDFHERWTRFVFTLLGDADARAYADVRGLIGQAVRVKTPDEEKQIARALIVEATRAWLDEKGRRYNWLYNVTENLRQQFEAIALQIVDGFENKADALAQLATVIQPALVTFQRGYREWCAKAPVPYDGCFIVCKNDLRCLYRYDVLPLAQDSGFNRDARHAIQSTSSDDMLWRNLAEIARTAGNTIAPPSNARDATGAALCFIAQVAAQIELSRESQRKLAREVKAIIETQP